MKTLFAALAIAFCLLAGLPAGLLAAPVSSSSIPGTMSEEQWVMLVYQKGKENYDRGDYENAAAEWDKLSGVVDRYPAFKVVIDYLRGKTKNISPESADQVEQQLAARKKKIDATFQKGKELYDQGKMNEALGAWDELASLLPEEAPHRRLIEDLRRYYIRSQETAAAGGLTNEESAEMQKFFATAAELFKTQAEQAKAALDASDQAQKTVDDSFSRAKLLYYQGDYGAAMKEIEKLAAYFSENSSERKSIETLTRVYEQSLDEKNSAQRALAQKSVKVKLPGDFGKFTTEVDEKFRAELKESESRRTGSERSLEDRQAWSSADLEKGIELYWQGKIDEAIRQWESVASDFENERTVRALIETAKKNQAELARIQSERAEALAEKQALLNSRLEKGRLLYEAGNFEDAKKEWNSVKSLVEDGDKVDAFLSQIEQVYQDSLKVKKAEDQAKSAASVRLATPESLSTMLAWAQEKLKSRIASANAQQAESQAAASERTALLQKTVSNGKFLIDSGKFTDAFVEWASLLPIVEDEAGLKKTLSALESDLSAAERAEREAREAESKKDAKTALPEDLSTLILEAGRQIRAQNDAASSRKKQAEQSRVDRQAFVSEHFDKGKLLFDSGKFGEALKEWSSLLPHLEDQAKLRPMIDQASQAQQALASAQKAALDAETSKDQKFKAPSDLAKLIEEARAEIAADVTVFEARKDSADKQFGQRQMLVQNTFDKGKVLYEEGRYSEAMKEWSAMLSELESAEEFRSQMKGIETRYDESIAESKAADEAERGKNAKLAPPPALKTLLAELEQKIAAQAQGLASRRAAALKIVQERQNGIDAGFAKGKLIFEQGDIPGSLDQWSALLPSLTEEAPLREKIASIRAEHVKMLESQRAAEESEKRQTSRVDAPAELEAALNEISVKLRGETSLAESRTEQAKKNLEDKKTLVRNTFEKGKTLHEQKQFREALEEWGSLLPHFENEEALRPLWERSMKEYETLALAQRAASDADSLKDAKVKAPEGLSSLLQETSDQLRIQTLEAKNRRDEAQHALEIRQADVDKAVMRGNALFREGKLEEAKTEWFSVLPGIEDEAAFTGTVDALSKLHAERMTVSQMEKETSEIPATRFKVPSDISAELTDASHKLTASRQEAEARRKTALEALAKRQAEVQEVFDKGKKFYWEGKLGEAVGAWSSIADQLEDPSVQTQITAVAQDYENLLDIQKETQDAELRKDNKLRTPAELPKVLEDVKQIVQSQTQYADTQKKIADQTYVDRQALINSTFQKGKNLYEQDRIPEALEEWASIAPYLEKGSELKEFIDGVARSHQESLTAQKAAEEAQLKRTIKFQTPPDLSRYLEEAGNKMKAQAEDSQMQKEAADRSRRERQIWVDGKFERGKLLYQQGDVNGAIGEWKVILPYIEDDSKVRQLILKAEENRKKLEDAVGADLVSAQTPEKVIIPPDLGKAVEAANLELEKSVAKNEREKLEADVLGVIQDKKKKSKKETGVKPAPASVKVPLDEIEQMMLEYNIATPQELEKRHQELKTVK